MKISKAKINKYEELIKSRKQKEAKSSYVWKMIGIVLLLILSLGSLTVGIYGSVVMGAALLIMMIVPMLAGIAGIIVSIICYKKSNNTYLFTQNKIKNMSQEDLEFEVELLLLK